MIKKLASLQAQQKVKGVDADFTCCKQVRYIQKLFSPAFVVVSFMHCFPLQVSNFRKFTKGCHLAPSRNLFAEVIPLCPSSIS